jgi:glucokinase
LEEFAGGPGLARRYGQLSGQAPLGAEAVFAAERQGDALARTVIQSAGAALGVSLGWYVNVLDPEAVVVGGGLGTAGGLYWESLVASTRAHIWAENTRTLPIVTARLGPEAGLIGAAVSAVTNQQQAPRYT